MSSSDTASSSTYSQSSTVYDVKPTAADLGPGAQAFQASLVNSQGNSISIVSESPQALAAAADITARAIDTASKAAQYAISVGAQQQEAARELAKSTTATASDQGTKFIGMIGVLILAGFGVWVFGGRKSTQGAK